MSEACVLTLGDFVEFRNGVNFSQADEGKGIPILKVKDFGALHSVPLAGFDELATGKVRVPESQFLRPKDIVIIRSNGNPELVGRSLIFKGAPNSVTFSGFCIRARVVRDVALPEFLHYWLRSPGTRASFTREGNGTGIQNLSQAYLANMRLSLPDISIQSRIVELLGSLDDKIELNRQMNETLEAMAQTIFRDWFVDFGPTRRKIEGASDPVEVMGCLVTDAERAQQLADLFPAGLGGNGLPVGWEPIAVEQALSVLETGSRPKGGVKGITSGTPSVGAESIVGIGRYDFTKTKYVPDDFFAAMKKGKVEDRDVLLYKDGGKPGAFEPHVSMFGSGFPFTTYAINEHVYRLRAKPPFSQEYLYFHLSSESASEEMRVKGTGVAIPGLNSTAVKSLSILRSSATSAYHNIVEPLVAKILANACETQSLASIRDLLLPKLMSGEIRLQEAVEVLEAAQ